MKTLNIRRHTQAGFTIIELLIATAVFSVILIIVTTGIMAFTEDYYRGINESNAQSIARTILNDIAQGIQFGSATNGYVQTTNLSTPEGGICINNVLYSYVLGKEVEPTPSSSQTPHAMVLQASPDCSSATDAIDVTNLTTLSAGQQELLTTNMRLANLSVTTLSASYPQAYQIDVRVVYGDDDLLSNPTQPTASCINGAGSQFCAVSDLSTVVEKRL